MLTGEATLAISAVKMLSRGATQQWQSQEQASQTSMFGDQTHQTLAMLAVASEDLPAAAFELCQSMGIQKRADQ